MAGGIQVLDGLFLACRREVAEKIGWDQATFDNWHCYDVDFSFRAHLAGCKLAVCNDLLAIHASVGNFDETWKLYAERFAAKFKGQLMPVLPRPYQWAGVRVATKQELVEAMTPPHWYSEDPLAELR